jgi:hypothetical protein
VGRNAAIDEVVDAIIVHHPAAPSEWATASITSTIVVGSASGPPYTFGTHNRIRSASASAFTVGNGSRRIRSPSSAWAPISSARPCAAARSDSRVAPFSGIIAEL